MSEETGRPAPSPKSQNVVKSFLGHLVSMPKLHKKVLAIAALLAGAGTAGQVSSYLSSGDEVSQTATMPAEASADTSGNSLVAESDASSVSPVPAPAAEPTVTQRVSPVAQKLGFGFIAGFVIGWAFRAFIKIMSLVTIVGVAIFGGLAYFDVDMSAIKTKFESGIGWVTEHGEGLADKAMKRLPGSAAGVTGILFGFRRKR